jgi:hypothetical protein
MAHLADHHHHHFVTRESVARANTALLLAVVWGGLGACAFGAMVYDFGRLIAIW